jgi:hypothetical protein
MAPVQPNLLNIQRLAAQRIGANSAPGAPPDQRYVQSLFSALLNRQPNANELATWVAFLQSGGTRVALVQSILRSSNYAQDIVSQMYAQYLLRAPNAAELAQWSNQLQTGMPVSTMMVAILASPEYFALATS